MNKNDFEISNQIKPGEIYFFINLSRVITQTPDQVIALVKEMGYMPELRYVTVFDREVPTLEVALLLEHKQIDPQIMPDDLEECLGEKMMDDFEVLWEALTPDNDSIHSVHIRRGLLPTKQPALA